MSSRLIVDLLRSIGNIFVAQDGRLAVLDWSLTARLSKADRETLVSIVLGGLTLDVGP